MSTEYYTQIEQARGAHPSREMLDSLAVALHLSRAEHDHLYHLAGEAPRPERQIPHEPPGSLIALLDRMTDTAVLVLDAKQEVIGWNALATLLFEDFAQKSPAERNLARRFFLHPDLPARHFGMTRSNGYAEYLATELRTAVARYPHDVALAVLIAELRSRSPRFERLWWSGEIYEPRHVQKKMVHPVAGPLRLWCDLLIVPECDQRAVLFTATPRTRSARALQSLAKHVPMGQRGTRTAA